MGKFSSVAVTSGNPAWDVLTKRNYEIYSRDDDIRGPFTRDYTRILHSMAYRRLKHKTQVFFNINNDHICTRMEHVSHVESVSTSIATYLGLNVELVRAISLGHDIGHAPFGHKGEEIISELTEKYLGYKFWHEKNGLRFVDDVELLEDNYKQNRNLNLTYAVRDGIISHCGEVDLNGLKPRNIDIPVEKFDSPGKYEAATWEGCVVKMSDKIAYVGRDIADATSLGFLNDKDQAKLLEMARTYDEHAMNTTVIMHNLILDICKNSSPDKGICLSPALNEQLKEIKAFNYERIYLHPRLKPFSNYSRLVINEIFEELLKLYDSDPRKIWLNFTEEKRYVSKLISTFESWIARYCDISIIPEGNLQAISENCKNKKIYERLQTKEMYIQAIIDFIAGMTDRFAIMLFNELLEY